MPLIFRHGKVQEEFSSGVESQGSCIFAIPLRRRVPKVTVTREVAY
jgi:hypothetical protein